MSRREADESSSSYLTALGDADVLLGRGAPIRKREANQRYLEYVKEQKYAYNATGKHAAKDQIARTIVDKVASIGGRFVRRVETEEERRDLGIPDTVTDAWVVVSDDVARDKCKQSLRDAAAALKKTSASSSSRKRKKSTIRAKDQSAKKLSTESVTNKAQSSLSGVTARSETQAAPETLSPKLSYSKPDRSFTSVNSGPNVAHSKESTLDNDDDLSFRLKHPSHRKRDLLRLRRLQQQQQQESTAVPEAPLLTGPTMKAERQSNISSATKLVATQAQSSSSLSSSLSSCSSSGEDRKPKARTDQG